MEQSAEWNRGSEVKGVRPGAKEVVSQETVWEKGQSAVHDYTEKRETQKGNPETIACTIQDFRFEQ